MRYLHKIVLTFVVLAMFALAVAFFFIINVIIETWRQPEAHFSKIISDVWGAFSGGVNSGLAGNIIWMGCGMLAAYVAKNWRALSIINRFTTGLIGSRANLDFDLVAQKFSAANAGAQILILKNWICNTDALIGETLADSILTALRAGANVTIAILHPRSPTARRRSRELEFSVPMRIEQTINALRHLAVRAKDQAESIKTGQPAGKLRIFCHDFLPTMQLFYLEEPSNKGWAQVAFYNNLGKADKSEQFEFSLHGRCGRQIKAHVNKILAKLHLGTPFSKEDSLGDFQELIFDPKDERPFTLVPLAIEADDIANSFTSISSSEADLLSSKIYDSASSYLNKGPLHSHDARCLAEAIYQKFHGLQGDAERLLCIRSISGCLDSSKIHAELRKMQSGETFYIFDNWLVGDCGLDVFEEMFIEAMEFGINLVFIILHPNSVIVDRRLAEVYPGVTSVRENILNTLKGIHELRLKTPTPKLELYCHDCIPSLQIFRGSQNTTIGFYLKDILASTGCQIEVRNNGKIGLATKDHIDYILKSGRIKKIEFDGPIDELFNGKLLPSQIAEMGETVANIQQAVVDEITTGLVSHVTTFQVDDYQDKVKLQKLQARIKGADIVARISNLRTFATSLMRKALAMVEKDEPSLNAEELEVFLALVNRLNKDALEDLKDMRDKLKIEKSLIKQLTKLLNLWGKS